MGDFSLAGGMASALHAGFDSSNVLGQTITASASTDTVGAWSEILSAAGNTESSDWLEVIVIGTVSADARHLVNIALGGSGSEQTIIPNLLAHSTSQSQFRPTYRYVLPFLIPSGERIAANVQSSTGSETVTVHLVRGKNSLSGHPALQRVTAYGADTSGTAGTTVARTTAGTFGAWVEIASSTTNPIKGFIVARVRDNTSWSSDARVSLEVAVGASSSEVVIFSGEITIAAFSEIAATPVTPFIPVQIAQGERVSIRTVGSAANTDLDLDHILYGVD